MCGAENCTRNSVKTETACELPSQNSYISNVRRHIQNPSGPDGGYSIAYITMQDLPGAAMRYAERI
jgi:hypothetical protein